MTKKSTKAATEPARHVIQNCHFESGVHWDGKSIEAIQTVAAALLENAKAAHALAAVFASQHIEMAPAIRISGQEPNFIFGNKVA